MGQDSNYQHMLTVTSDGSGDGTATSEIYLYGTLSNVVLDYGASVAATCDVTISLVRGGLTLTLAVVSDSNTDAIVGIGIPVYGAAGDTSTYAPVVLVGDKLKVTVAQAGDTKTVTAHFAIA